MNEVSYGAPRPEAVRDLGETIAAQQVAGPTATDDLARNFLARVQRDIDEQVDLRVQQRLAAALPRARRQLTSNDLGLALGSLGIGVPLSGIAGYSAGFPGILIVWIGIVIINVAWAQRH